MSNYVLLAVPLFIFMGVILEKSGIAEELLETMALLFGKLFVLRLATGNLTEFIEFKVFAQTFLGFGNGLFLATDKHVVHPGKKHDEAKVCPFEVEARVRLASVECHCFEDTFQSFYQENA